MMDSVSSRTRSKKALLFGSSVSLDGSGSVSGSKRRRVNEEPFVVPENAEIISLDEDDSNGDCDNIEEKSEEGGVSDVIVHKVENSVEPENVEVIDIDADDEHLEDYDMNRFEGDNDVEEVKGGGSGEFVEEDESGGSDEENSDDFDSNDEEEDESDSEEDDTSDEEFEVDEVNGISDDYEDEKEEEKKKYYNVMELTKKANAKKSGIFERENDFNIKIEFSTSTSFEKGSASSSSSSSSFKPNKVSEKYESKCVEMEKITDSARHKTMKNMRRENKGRVSISKGGKKVSMDSKGLNQRAKSTLFTQKELRLVNLLAECFWVNKSKPAVYEAEVGVVNQGDTRIPKVCVDTPPLIWTIRKVEKHQKSKEEEEAEEEEEKLRPLWEQMNIELREQEAESMIGNLGTNEASEENMESSRCKHDVRLDDEIGIYCRLCGWVITEIKYISPPMIDKIPNERSEKRASFGGENASIFDGSQFNVSNDNSETNFTHNEGTVWDLIPAVKETLYPHQQEGFEFIWKNLAGNIDLHKLKNTDPRSEGGCIISHAPGTGKTRLTIVFLKAYLKVFPKCLPIIVAPTTLLRTWEDEFKKWDIGVPFHILNNLELTAKEHADAFDTHDWFKLRHSKEATRMAKLISWFKEKSILGISYDLFKSIVGGGKSIENKKKKHACVKNRKENGDMGKVLLKAPGLLVLDEGHTPRNQRSHIWKVLSMMQTPKRILLSGTPFQNNFLELYNTLSLVKPSFPNMLPPELKKKQCKTSKSKEWSWEPVLGNSTTSISSDDQIKQLRSLMDPFVHVHEGAILQKNLPGLKYCVVRLKPENLQKQILENIQSSQNTLIFEHKLTMTSVHPSLFLECDLLEEEESAVDKDLLEQLLLNPYAGVKTKFLVELVRLCDAVKEKVLVFSQYIAPLELIKDQLNSVFKWHEGKEVLFMHGKLNKKQKQSLIDSFSEASCQAKIVLASTHACSEGISLVRASRVVLLDVLWNPSVKRQAIGRAYRFGQEKVVYVYDLLTQGTTEYVKHSKQAEKDRLSELVFSDKNTDNSESKSCAMNFEDIILDKMTQHEKLKDMFVECVVEPKECDLVENFDS